MNLAVAGYRLSNRVHRLGFHRVAQSISWVNRLIFSGWIPGSATIGSDFVCGYWGLGVVIHKDAVIGRGCTISQNVTIGRNGKRQGIPVIGDNVYVGAGAVIVGGIKIGDYSQVGANSVVLSDVPECAVVVGAPARVVRFVTRPQTTC